MNAHHIGGAYTSPLTGVTDRVFPMTAGDLAILHAVIKEQCEVACGSAEMASNILKALGLVADPHPTTTATEVMASLRLALASAESTRRATSIHQCHRVQ